MVGKDDPTIPAKVIEQVKAGDDQVQAAFCCHARLHLVAGRFSWAAGFSGAAALCSAVSFLL